MPILPNVQNIVGQGLAPAARDSIGRTQERLRNGRRAWKTSPAAVRAEQVPPLQRRHQKTAASLSFRGTSNKAERRCALHCNKILPCVQNDCVVSAGRFFALLRMIGRRISRMTVCVKKRKNAACCHSEERGISRPKIAGKPAWRIFLLLRRTGRRTSGMTVCVKKQKNAACRHSEARGISQTVRLIPLNETDGGKNRMDSWRTRERLSSP